LTWLLLLLTTGRVGLALHHGHIHPCSAGSAAAAAATACARLVLVWQRCTDALTGGNSSELWLVKQPAGQQQGIQ
jgi:hypothetical protein